MYVVKCQDEFITSHYKNGLEYSNVNVVVLASGIIGTGLATQAHFTIFNIIKK